MNDSVKSVKKIRFGVVGTNTISDKVIAGALLDPRFVLTSVYSRTQAQADWFASRHAIPHTYTSLELMAESPLIDAVYIASPNSLHASQSILFMKHGKHVLCEKAFASNAREVREMIATATTHKVVLMEAMKPTLTPNFAAVCDALPAVGKVRNYFSCYCQYSSRYDKFKEGVVLNAFNPVLSNGALLDIGVYTIYPMVVLFGAPKSIQATGFKLSSGVDAQGSVSFIYDNMTATILFSKVSDSTLPTEIQGEDGTIWLDRINIIKEVTLSLRNGEKRVLTRPHCGEDYYYEVAEFIDLIQSGRIESLINSHANSLITMQILDQIRHQLGVRYPAD
ncbi:MAG: Gfo/Idh/MocA family oxidoreductase [Bacteroidales bacterium]|nr:Gfo/Idh/MocA family oxidoreductase [Bacteroidales bacterium]MDD4821543.1 Gfo/Idh/MocA family oxidoreductase [Bacteroidales bacterium]